MGGQGLCSVSADGNKTLIITSQAAKHYQIDNLMFCGWPDLRLLKFYFHQQ